MIRLDIRYAQEKSLWLDFRIILMTLPALLIQILDTRRGRQQAAPSPRPAAAITAQTSRPTP